MIGLLAATLALSAAAPAYATAQDQSEPPATGDWRILSQADGRAIGLDVAHVETQGQTRLAWVVLVTARSRPGSYAVTRMEIDCSARSNRALWFGVRIGPDDPVAGAAMDDEARPFDEGSTPAAIARVVCDNGVLPGPGATTPQAFAAAARPAA